MLTAPWVWIAVWNGALNLSAEEPWTRGAALRGAAWMLILADSEAEALVGLNVAREESRWNPWARNDKCADSGAPLVCCGVGQIAARGPWHCARLGAIEVESWSTMLAVMRHGAPCGPTWHEALTRYVSGRCGIGVGPARARCARVGLCGARARCVPAGLCGVPT